MPDKKRERCLREVQLLGNVTHGNVVRMLDSFLDDRYLVIVFEWADGGDLRQFVRARREAKKPLDEPEIWTVFAQIVDALAHLHRRDVGVAHRDVKPANVLVVNGVVKLADLGLGKRVDEGDAPSGAGEDEASDEVSADGGMRSKVGTPYYVAPEIVRGDAYGLKSDVWSLGCLLYELAALRSPFEMTGPGADVKHVFRRIGKHEFVPLTENGRHSHALVSLITVMLDADPRKRPTMETVRATCQLARASFDAVDRLGPVRGVYAAAERVCDRLALLSARGGGARASTGARPKPGVLELALGQPGVFVEASPNETDATRFARVARLAAWLLPLARSRRAIPPPRYRRISPTRSARSDSPPRSRRTPPGNLRRNRTQWSPAGARDAREAPQAAARPGALGRGAVQPAAPERRRARLRLRGGARGVFQRGGCRGTRPRRDDERNVVGSREPPTTWPETDCGNRRRQKNAGARGR